LLIAKHERRFGSERQYVSEQDHMPEKHKAVHKWNKDSILNWANKIGQATIQVIKSILERTKIEQQGYKTSIAILS
jgi:hypothetical protein